MWSAHHSRLQTHHIRPLLASLELLQHVQAQPHIEPGWRTASHSMDRVERSTQRPFIYFL